MYPHREAVQVKWDILWDGHQDGCSHGERGCLRWIHSLLELQGLAVSLFQRHELRLSAGHRPVTGRASQCRTPTIENLLGQRATCSDARAATEAMRHVLRPQAARGVAGAVRRGPQALPPAPGRAPREGPPAGTTGCGRARGLGASNGGFAAGAPGCAGAVLIANFSAYVHVDGSGLSLPQFYVRWMIDNY